MIGKNTESDVTSRENQIWHTNILIWYYSDVNEYIRIGVLAISINVSQYENSERWTIYHPDT